MVNFVNKALTTCLGPKNKNLIIERFLSSPKIRDDTLEYVLLTKLAIAQQEVLARMHKYLEEIKLVSSSAKHYNNRGTILRSTYHRKQQRKKFLKACLCEP